MSVTDPDCGVCQTLTMPSGKAIEIQHLFPKALSHYYPLPALDATSIPIYRGDFDLEGTRYRGVINIDLDPSPNLVAHGVRETTPSAGLVQFLGQRQPSKWVNFDQISIPARKIPAPALTARLPRRPATIGSVSSSYKHVSGIDVGDLSDLDQVTFYLLNGWYGLDGLNTCYENDARTGRIDTTLGDWQVRIEPRGDVPARRLRDHQRATGRSTITHVGRIRRDDGGRFNGSDAMAVLQIVESLAGFALGRVTAIVLPVGYCAGIATWARWECNRVVDRPVASTPFLDHAHTAAQMTELFRAGYDTSRNPLRWEVFKNALGYHYSTEYDATVNMKVLLPVSALQLISYAHLVEELPVGHPHHLTNKQWGDKSTTTQLRNVLTVAGVDMSVPKHLAQLMNVQAGIADNSLPTPDALDCVVRLRNKVAHPKQKDANTWTTEEWAEAGFAATTMFNLAMLWWLGYDERYMGKTSEYRGADESIYVPWHKP